LQILSKAHLTGVFSISCLALFGSPETGDGDGAFNPGAEIMHHIQDAHQLHFFSIGSFQATIHLPVIALSKDGIAVFGSKKLHHGGYKGYYLDEHHKLKKSDGRSFLNLSITKNVLMMLVGAGLVFLMFRAAARGYGRREGRAPKGLQSFLEPLVVFIRDEVARPIMGDKANRYLPYLLTVFFFIWTCNLIGLVPGFAANITGNIAVTLTLALFTFLITMFSSTKHYWGHIIRPPGVPPWVLPIIVIVEVFGIFVKPAALCIRLFANMTAGHMVILSIISLIFIFGQMSPVGGFGISILSIAFGLFMFLLELLVAVLQAYIFTILSALFISEAATSPQHH